MLKVSTASVKNFQSKASSIQRNEMLPILSNLKLECDGETLTLTKNAMSAICTGQIEMPEGSDKPRSAILVDETVFFKFVSKVKTKEFTIEVVKGEVILKSDEARVNLPMELAENFPKTPEATEELATFKFLSSHMRALKIATSFVNPVETAGLFQFVHVSRDNIFAIHPNFFYVNNSFTDLPSTAFRTDEIKMIMTHEQIDFVDTKNYHLFYAPGYSYAFSKSEATSPKVEVMLERLRIPGKDCKMNLKDLVDFCDLSNSVSPSPIATCTISQEGQSGSPFVFAKMILNDKNYSRGNERMTTIDGEIDEFSFNSRVYITAISAIPEGDWSVNTKSNCFIVKDGGQKEWFCFIGQAKL